MRFCRTHPLLALAACLTVMSLAGIQLAKAEPAIEVTIKDHHFTPAEIHVPAGKPAILNIKNDDATA